MTKNEAIQKLTETRELSTDLLEPLGIQFETFLRFGQLPKQRCDALIGMLIESYKGIPVNRN